MASVGRPPSCTCGECRKCKNAAYMREWWSRKSLEERRAAIARRDAARVRRADRERSRGNPERTGRPWKDEAKRREARQRYVDRNPEKIFAHRQVRYAIRDGRLVRQPCEVCGAEPTHAHHDDYGKPLDVRWLCPKHHRQVHWVEDDAGERAA